MDNKLLPMHKGKAYSPETTTVGVVSGYSTEIEVKDGSALAEGPAWATLTDLTYAETIVYEKRRGNRLENVTRRVEEGDKAREWAEGTIIANFLPEARIGNISKNVEILSNALNSLAPTVIIGAIEHELDRYPLCTLHKTQRAAGIDGEWEVNK